MAQKAWLAGDTVINDEEGLTSAYNTVISALEEGAGLYGTRVHMQSRYGRWPLIGAVERQAKELTLKTFFRGATAAARKTQRDTVKDALNYEEEETSKLTVADTVAPEGLLFAFGPWDVYSDDDGNWYADDVFKGDAIVSLGTSCVNFDDGPNNEQKALAVEGAETNEVYNPVFEDNVTDNWTLAQGGTGGSKTHITDLDYVKFGAGSMKITSGTDYVQVYSNTYSLPDNDSATVSCYVLREIDKQATLRLWDSTSATSRGTMDASGTIGEWERLSVSWRNQTGSSANVRLEILNHADDSETNVWVDGCQLENTPVGNLSTLIYGSRGPGFTWGGTEHNSASSRALLDCALDDYVDLIDSLEEGSLRIVARMPADYDGEWPVGNAFLFHLYESDNDEIYVYYFTGDDKFHATFEKGGTSVDVTSSAQTFSQYDWMEILVTFDYDGNAAIYTNGADEQTGSLSTVSPILNATSMNLGDRQDGLRTGGYYFSEFQWWDRQLSSDEAASMYANDSVGGRARYVNVLAKSVERERVGRAVTDNIVSILTIDGDVRYRTRDGDVAFWRVYGDTSQMAVNVDSDDLVRPILRFTPKGTKSVGFQYKKWLPIHWRADYGYTRYPYLVEEDTSTLNGAGKVQGDLDDLRVYSDGAEIDRWLDSTTPAASTNIWFNLDFQATVDMTLKTAIASSGDVDEIELNEDISGLDFSGIVLIDNEAFVYTSKTDADKTLRGVKRAAKGTSMAAHTVDTTAEWVQHDVWLFYSDSSLSAPTTDDEYKPAFDLSSSSNTSWVYDGDSDLLGEDDGDRAAQWQSVIEAPQPEAFVYHGNQGTDSTDPWDELGQRLDLASNPSKAYHQLYNPCEITNVNVTGGENYWDNETADVTQEIVSKQPTGTSWVTEYTIPWSTEATWNSWTQSQAIDSGAVYVAFKLEYDSNASGNNLAYLEVRDVTITLNSSKTPDGTLGSEQTNYELDATLTNDTTGDEIQITLQTEIDEIVEIDTYEKTLKTLSDGQSHLDAKTLVGGTRREWFKFKPGVNKLSFSDTGTAELEIDMYWDRRYWE